jgi:nucleoid-associated protein YgaU
MLVKLKVSRAGDRFSQVPGDVIDVDEDEAGRLIEAGQADACDADGKVTPAPVTREAAATTPPENAAIASPGKRKPAKD